MIRKKPTLTDIAREAGVSQSTVSLVFSGKGRISDDIREKVFSIADKLGYKRNFAAPLQSKHSSQNIAILVHMDYEYLWNCFHPTIAEIDSVLSSAGYNLVILPIGFKSDEDSVFQKIATTEVAAVFSLHYAKTTLFTKLERAGIPVIILHNCDYQNKFYSVSFDDLQGAYEATSYLLKLGHTRIAYVEYIHKDLFSIKNDRFFGFKKAMDEYNVRFNEHLKVSIDYNNMEEANTRLSKILDQKERPTAIFVHDDYLALRVIRAINGMGLAVPEDISIIAPGDVLVYTEPHVPQITTMRINTSLIGKMAAELLLNRLQKNPDDVHVLKVKEQLVDRGSCRSIESL